MNTVQVIENDKCPLEFKTKYIRASRWLPSGGTQFVLLSTRVLLCGWRLGNVQFVTGHSMQ